MTDDPYGDRLSKGGGGDDEMGPLAILDDERQYLHEEFCDFIRTVRWANTCCYTLLAASGVSTAVVAYNTYAIGDVGTTVALALTHTALALALMSLCWLVRTPITHRCKMFLLAFGPVFACSLLFCVNVAYAVYAAGLVPSFYITSSSSLPPDISSLANE